MLAWLKRMLTPNGEETVARSFTRKNALCLLSFALVFCLLFAGAERLFYSDSVFSSTWNRIREKGDVPRVLILGNSHAFCSFVPDILNGALQTDAAVLGASGQNSAGVADNLETTLQTGKPDMVVVELNTMYYNFNMMKNEHKSAALSNISGMPGYARRANVTWQELGFENIPQGMFQLLRADMMWSRWSALAKTQANRYAGEDVLGYSYMNWHATGRYDAAGMQAEYRAILEASQPMPLNARNEEQLRRIIRLAALYDVPLLLVKAPTALNNPDDAARLRYIEQMVREDGATVVAVHDFRENVADMGFTLNDFYDGGHVSRQGAAKFSAYFSTWLGELMGVPAEPNNAFAYADEAIEPLSGGQARFTMNTWGQDVQYRFTVNGEVLKDWSSENSIVLALDPSDADELSVSMCPKALLDEADWYALTLPFMVGNSCELK